MSCRSDGIDTNTNEKYGHFDNDVVASTIGIGITYTETVTAQTNNNMISGSTQNQTDEFEV